MDHSEIEKFYRDDAYLGFGQNFSSDQYQEYVQLVKKHVAKQSVIEIGSGLGAAAYALHKQSIKVIASDLFPDSVQNKFAELKVEIPVIELNATKNILPTSSVENYALNQVLEHLEDPLACFQQCFRTLKPFGKIVIVSPNLMSPLGSGLVVLNGITQRWKTPWFRRSDGYTFPFGDSVLGNIGYLIRNLFLTFKLRLIPGSRTPRFRIPSFKKPALSDSDAVFLTEPLTVREMLIASGFQIVSFQENRRTNTWAGSIWIVAQKPALEE